MKKFIAMVVLVGGCLIVPAQAAQPVSVESTPKLAELAEKLNFSEVQKGQLNQLLKNYSDNIRKVQANALALQLEMRRLKLSDLDAATVDKLSKRSGDVAAAHTRELLNTQKEFYRLLNARQKNDYARLREQAQAQAKSQGAAK